MPTLYLQVLGGISVHNGGSPLGPAAAQPKRLALLALLARAGTQGLSRDRVLALLWPESDDARARNALNQTLFALRRDLGEAEAIEGSALLKLNPDIIASDVQAFEEALRRGELDVAVRLYGGPFLDGFHVRDTAEFEQWAESERTMLESKYRGALDQFARQAAERKDLSEEQRALELWVRSSPHDATPVRRLATSLERSGQLPAALQVVAAYAARLRHDLELEPDSELLALGSRYRRTTSQPPESGTAIREPAPERQPPERRRRRWSGLAAALAPMLLAGAWLLTRANPLDPDRVHVLLPPPPADTLAARLLQTLQDWMVQGIRDTRRFTVTEAVAGSPDMGSATVAKAARQVGAGTGLALDFKVLSDSISARVTLADAKHGTLTRLIRLAIPKLQPSPAADALRQQVLAALAAGGDPGVSAPSSWESFQLFVAGRDLFVRTGGDEALRLLAQAGARDSAFTLPLVWQMFALMEHGQLFSADTLRRRLQQHYAVLPPLEAALFDMTAAGLDGDGEAEYSAAQRVAAADRSHEWGYWAAKAALSTGYPRAALRYLEAVSDSSPWRSYGNGVPYWRSRFWSRIAARDYGGLLSDRDAAVSASPAVARISPVYVARALAGLGRSVEVMILIRNVASGTLESDLSANDIVRLIVPYLNAANRHETALAALALIDSAAARSDQAQRGYEPNSVSWRAPMAYWRRNWALARVLYDSAGPVIEQAIAAHNWNVASMGQSRRGALAARVGDKLAARRLEAWLAITPDSASVHPSKRSGFVMGQARIEAALGNRDRAIELIAAAQRISWDGTVWMDAEFETLRGNPVFERLTRPKD